MPPTKLAPLYGWRLMLPQDIEAVSAIAARCHPNLPERAAVLAEKQHLAPQSCFALERRAAAGRRRICGYILAHGWPAGSIPKLDGFLRAVPEAADTLYLHDLALLESARSQGLAAAGLKRLEACGQKAGFKALALVAVNHSAGFWQAQGFAPIAAAADETLAKGLAGYGAAARYMVKPLPGRR